MVVDVVVVLVVVVVVVVVDVVVVVVVVGVAAGDGAQRRHSPGLLGHRARRHGGVHGAALAVGDGRAPDGPAVRHRPPARRHGGGDAEPALEHRRRARRHRAAVELAARWAAR